MKTLAESLGCSELELRRNPDLAEQLNMDSLDVVELILQLEADCSS